MMDTNKCNVNNQIHAHTKTGAGELALFYVHNLVISSLIVYD